MKIEELIKDFDPVSIIEFKNYLAENLSELCKAKNSNAKIISNHRDSNIICKYCNIGMCKNGKTKNMLRYSKKRTSTKSSYRGISHHKICTVSSIDEDDNLILEIAGLGRCTQKC